MGVQIQVTDKINWNQENCFLSGEDTERLDLMCRTKVPENAIHFNQQVPMESYLNSEYFFKASQNICFSLFETDRCPVPWVSKLNRCTKTLVFSKFNVQTYSNSGVNNVDCIPFGVDTKLFNPSVKPFRFGRDKDEFVFLTSGDFTERKNFEGLIESYVKEFNSNDKVCLIIKAHYSGFTKIYKEMCIRKLKQIVTRFNGINPPKILFLGEKIPWYDMPKFYTAGDCFILTTRGEGLGYPFAEALASGVPVIAPDFGGQSEFLNSTNSLIVNYEVRVIDDLEYLRKCIISVNHSWCHPHVPDIRSKMRFAYDQRDLMKEKGLRGRADMEKYTWQASGLEILKKVFNI
uniref:Putative glycosyltransferase n=1 Tax=viral metagenome TaxID=1070528 RepID=A0A6M3L8J2_9ZZZZ